MESLFAGAPDGTTNSAFTWGQCLQLIRGMSRRKRRNIAVPLIPTCPANGSRWLRIISSDLA